MLGIYTACIRKGHSVSPNGDRASLAALDGWSSSDNRPHKWAEATEFVQIVLDVEQRACEQCGRRMTICDHRRHPVFTLSEPTLLVCRLVNCPDRSCPGHHRTVSPEGEAAICQPRLILAWDGFCWVGHRRFSRHWSVPQIRTELLDTSQVSVSEGILEDAIARYQAIVAAREQDFPRLADVYRDVDEVVLTIDGLQPEKGPETLSDVRELTKKRIWFGEPLVCSSADEVRRAVSTGVWSPWRRTCPRSEVTWMWCIRLQTHWILHPDCRTGKFAARLSYTTLADS